MKHTFPLIFLSLLLFSSCSRKTDKEKAEEHNDEKCITIATVPTMDCLPLFVAYESHFLDSLGYSMSLRRYMSISACATAFMRGSVCAAPSDYQYAVKMASDSTVLYDNPNVILAMFLNHRARLKEAKQLADKMVACDRKGASGILAQHVLDSVGLKSDKAFLVNFPDILIRLKMMENNEMDAVILPEPQASVTRKDGNPSVYATSYYGGHVIGRLAARRKTADVIRRLYNRACDSINARGVHAYDSILIKHLYVPESALQSVKNRKYKKI